MYRSVAGFYDDVLGKFNAIVTNLEVVWVLQAFTSNWLQHWNFHSSSTPKLHTEASKKFHANKNIIRTTFWLCVASYLEEFFFVFPVPKSIQLRKVTAESLRLITIWAMVAETKKMRTLSHDSEKLSRITIKFHQENEKKIHFRRSTIKNHREVTYTKEKPHIKPHP